MLKGRMLAVPAGAFSPLSLARRVARQSIAADAAYLLVAGILLLAISWIHIFAPVNIVSYDRDVWHHTAVLNALLESPWHATNPHIDSEFPSRTYMPWYVGLALLGRGLGHDAQQLLGFSAALSVLTLAGGIWLFARAYFASRWAPLILLLVTFGSWTGWNHTGFHALSTMVFSASYPFAIVFGAGYVLWWLVLTALRAPRRPLATLAAIILLIAFMFTTHQLQAAFAIGGALVMAVLHGHHAAVRRVAIVAAVFAGIVLTHWWPYFSPITLAETGGFYTIPFTPPFDWTDPLSLAWIFGLSPLGLAGLYDFRRRAWRLDLLLGLAGILAGIAMLYAIGSWMVLRFIPFLAVFLQLGLTGLLLDHPAPLKRDWLRPALAGLVAVMLVLNIGTATASFVNARAYMAGRSDVAHPGWSRDAKGAAEAVRNLIGAGSIVIADWTTAYPIQANRMKVVSIPYHFPEVPDSTGRQQASRLFFAAETTAAQRCRILADYAVDAIVFRSAMVPVEVQEALAAFGTAIDVRELSVIRLAGRPGVCPPQ